MMLLMMFIVSPYFFVYQTFIGTAGQLPLGIPPKPEMAVMSQVAPEECAFYVSFAGLAKADPKSPNLSEQFMAQPSTQVMIKSVDDMILKTIIKNNDENREASLACYALIKQFMTCPWCAFASDIEFSADDFPEGHLGMMVCLEDQREAFEKSMETLLKEAELLDKIKTVTIDGKTYRQYVDEDDEDQVITWGIISLEGKPMLLVGVGKGTIEGMLQRAKTPAPKWLSEVKKKLPIQRRATLTYVNVKKLREAIVPVMAQGMVPSEAVSSVFDMLGLGNVKAFMATTGLDETGMVDHLLLETEGAPKGMVAAMVGSDLTAKDLAAVPADANVFMGMKIDAVKVYTAIGEMLEKMEPQVRLEFEMSAQHAAEATGFHNFKKLLGAFGQTWTMYNSPGEGGPLYTGLTVSVEVNDSFVQFRAAIETMLTVLGQDDPDGPQLVTKKYRGTDITYLNFKDDVPVVPCWCVKDGRLFLSLTPQNIRTILDRDPKTFKSIATVPEIANALAMKPAPSALMYSDPKSLLQIAYPMLPYLVPVGKELWGKDYKDLEADLVASLPSLPSILPYGKPTLRVLRRTDSGVEFKVRSTLPGPAFTSSTPFLYVGAAIPLMLAGEAKAHQEVSRGNMKQIGLAFQNYASERSSDLPPAYTVDKKGKPLLSWRVHILPYIEQGYLYEQFHLDEPWDSPHNKKLIPLMPDVYQSPKSKAGEGKATYLTVRTKKSAFPGKEKVKLTDISDGTSNTIALVEVNDATAVPWTKPDDFTPDKKDPTKGLRTNRNGKFNVGFLDGSVRKSPASIDKEILQCLFTRNGGETVDDSDLCE